MEVGITAAYAHETNKMHTMHAGQRSPISAGAGSQAEVSQQLAPVLKYSNQTTD